MIAQVDSNYIRMRPTKFWNRLVSYALFEGRPLTTRGRWINPLIFAHFALEQRLPQLRQVRKPIFIIGTGRSGTTVLGVLLSMHREVGFLNEPKALWHAIHPGEDLIGSYSRSEACYRLGEDVASQEMEQRAHRLYGAYLFATGAQRVVDKYPEMVFRVPFIRKLFPDAKFLFLVRNGWDTCHSIGLWSKRRGIQKGQEIQDWWGANDRKWHFLIDQVASADPLFESSIELIRGLVGHTDRAVAEWVLTMREGLRLCRDRSDYMQLVRYEELVGAPEMVLQNILEFCELSEDSKVFQYATQTLSPALPKESFQISEHLRDAFMTTMTELGYVT